jgi:hypothetical protein
MRIKRVHELTPVNEEIIGPIINFFKNMWNKAIVELEKAANDPNKIKDYVINNTFNVKDDTNVFSEQIKTFKALPTANDQASLDLISNILDPETGCLGKPGIGVLLSNKKLQGESMQAKRKMLEFILTTTRDEVSKQVKYITDPKKRNVSLDDLSYLPDFKKILKAAGTDEKKKKDDTLNYVNTNLIPKLVTAVKVIKEEAISDSLKKAGIKVPTADYVAGDLVKYKTKKFDPTKDEDDQPEGGVAQGEVKKVEGDTVTIYNDRIKTEIKKPKTDIIGKTEGQAQKEGGENAKKAAEELSKIKDDEEKMDKIAKFAKYIRDDANKDKVAEIEKSMGGQVAAQDQTPA